MIAIDLAFFGVLMECNTDNAPWESQLMEKMGELMIDADMIETERRRSARWNSATSSEEFVDVAVIGCVLENHAVGPPA